GHPASVVTDGQQPGPGLPHRPADASNQRRELVARIPRSAGGQSRGCRVNGLPWHRMAVRQFAHEYTTVRHAEGWGSPDGRYYRALPYRDLTGRNPGIWRIRARTYGALVERVLVPLESQPRGARRRLKILDLGAGNGWLANRLTQRGHSVTAIDLLDDALDGLGAARH